MNRIAFLPRTLLSATLVLALASAAQAEKKETRVASGLSASQFVQNCEGMGGTIDEGSGGEDTVQCTLPNGTNADCSFGPKDAYCEVTTPRTSISPKTAKGLLGASTVQVLK
jgi:hypothetical protein